MDAWIVHVCVYERGHASFAHSLWLLVPRFLCFFVFVCFISWLDVFYLRDFYQEGLTGVLVLRA